MRLALSFEESAPAGGDDYLDVWANTQHEAAGCDVPARI
jgi:hypothetical protein